MMNKRERYLSLSVLGIVGAYAMFLVAQRAFLSPREAQDAQIHKLTADIAAKQKEMDRAIRAGDQLAEWEKRSLPADDATAKALYQEFLFKLMRESRIPESDYTLNTQKVHSSAPKYFAQIPFVIRGRATLENLTDFLYRFEAHKNTILHQVRLATISRAPNEPGGKLQFMFDVEALALKTGPNRDRLVPEGDSEKPMIADRPRETFKLIATKNIFEPHREPTRQAAPPREREIDAAEYIVFTGFTSTGDEPLAWFYNQLTKDNKQFRAGDDFDLAGVRGTLVSVSAGGLILEKDNKQWRLKLGRKLKELALIAGAGATTAGDADGDKPDSEKPESPAPATGPAGGPVEPSVKDRSVGPLADPADVRESPIEPRKTAEKPVELRNGVKSGGSVD